MTADTSDVREEYRDAAPPVRAVLGGALMGLANLVPGISGGTMLLAAGVYPQFIDGIAEISTFRFRRQTIVTLSCIIVAMLVIIFALAGPISRLVVDHRWIMYSLFIGLTLGGVPILWRMLRPVDPLVVVMSIIGIAIMAVMALIGPGESTASDEGTHQYAMYFIAGVAGASAMVLPGISGSYLLLILGQYITILAYVSLFKDSVLAGEWGNIGWAMHVLAPVGLGVVVGVVGLSNLIRLLLRRFERLTLGFLLGLLLGAVIGLWPFQQSVETAVGMPRDKTEYFTPQTGQVVGSLALIAVGFLFASLVSRLGGKKPIDTQNTPDSS